MRDKRVCMFVWNHFTNDARVTREAKTLIEAGYEVWVIAVHAADVRRYEKIEGIKIIRVQKGAMLNWFKKKKQTIISALRKIFPKRKGADYGSSFLTIFKDFILSLAYFVTAILRVCNIFLKLLRDLINYITFGGLKEVMGLLIMNLNFASAGKMLNADIYHSNDLNTLLAGYICSRKNKSKLVYDSHEICTDKTGLKIKAIWHFLERKLIRKADVVIFTTYTRAKFTADRYNIKLPNVIGNYTDIPENVYKIDLRALLNLNGNKIVLYQGGLQKGRGLEQLIDAVPFMRKDVTVVIIGGGTFEQLLKDKVKNTGLEDRVKFTGRIAMRELLGYTASADVGLQILQNICFNHYSTDSNKLFEYLAVGVPVVASDFPEIRKVVTDYNVGVLIDPHVPENIAAGVNKILADEQAYHQMKINARKASEVLNWQNESKNFLKIYKDLNV